MCQPAFIRADLSNSEIRRGHNPTAPFHICVKQVLLNFYNFFLFWNQDTKRMGLQYGGFIAVAILKRAEFLFSPFKYAPIREASQNIWAKSKKRSLRLLEEKRDSTFMIPLIERGTLCDQVGCRFLASPFFNTTQVLVYAGAITNIFQ